MNDTVAENNKFSKQVLIDCTPEVAYAIVQPIIEMSLLVMGLNQNTKPKEVEAKAAQLLEAKELLCGLLEERLRRQVTPERLSGFYLATSAITGGAFDLTFTETTPSAQGNLTSVFKVRLLASRKTMQERFLQFVQTNNPMARGHLNEFTRQVIAATGM